MATSPTSKSAPLSNAAKNDALGHDGDFTFTISDLLANDAGGAKASSFFFGSGDNGGLTQAEYMSAHGIVDNHDGTFTLTSDAFDFTYSVQIGNKGTWSTAAVDVTAPEPVVDQHHNGALAAEWTFENHTQAGGDNTGTPNGFWNLNQWAADHLGVYGEEADSFGFTADIQVHGTDGHRALDTAGSPGNIFLQAIPEGRGGVLGQGATMPDLVDGRMYHAEVSILKQDYHNDPAMVAAGTDGTDPDAWVQFNFNNETLTVRASDIDVGNEFVKFDLVFKGVEGEDSFSIMSHGTDDDAQGLLIDTIQVYDWLI
jgi:hypothetical protein